MPKLPSLPDLSGIQNILLATLVAAGLLGGGLVLARSSSASPTTSDSLTTRATVTDEYDQVSRRITSLENAQAAADASVVSDATIRRFLTPIQIEIETGQYTAADNLLKQLTRYIDYWSSRLPAAPATPTPTPVPPPLPTIHPTPNPNSRFVPILLYHYTPADFERQVEVLAQRGYTTVTLQQVATAFRGGAALPEKPVVITFDDGFANQMQAFDILRQHGMKATYFIINGGPESLWCIGAGRRYGDPLQPPQGCGDAYLSWDQVRTLDASGLITIGGHTLNHRNLASLSTADQRHEIIDSKAGIEQEIGHPIYDFAYPYGNFNATTIQIVIEAGYSDAVTTLPGSYQLTTGLYVLRRIRDTYNLP